MPLNQKQFNVLLNKFNHDFQENILKGKDGNVSFVVDPDNKESLAEGQLSVLAGSVMVNKALAKENNVKVKISLFLGQTRLSEYDLFALKEFVNCEIQIAYDLNEIPLSVKKKAQDYHITLEEISKLDKLVEVGNALFYPNMANFKGSITNENSNDLAKVCAKSLVKMESYVEELKHGLLTLNTKYDELINFIVENKLSTKNCDKLIKKYSEFARTVLGERDLEKTDWEQFRINPGLMSEFAKRFKAQKVDHCKGFIEEIRDYVNIVSTIRKIQDMGTDSADREAYVFCLITTLNAIIGRDEKFKRDKYVYPQALLSQLVSNSIEVSKSISLDLSSCMSKKYRLIEKFYSFVSYHVKEQGNTNPYNTGVSFAVDTHFLIDLVCRYLLLSQKAIEKLNKDSVFFDSVKSNFDLFMDALDLLFDQVVATVQNIKADIFKKGTHDSQNILWVQEHYLDLFQDAEKLFSIFFIMLNQIGVEYSIDDMLKNDAASLAFMSSNKKGKGGNPNIFDQYNVDESKFKAEHIKVVESFFKKVNECQNKTQKIEKISSLSTFGGGLFVNPKNANDGRVNPAKNSRHLKF